MSAPYNPVRGYMRHGYPIEPNNKKEAAALRAEVARRGACPDCGEIGEKRGHQDCGYPS